MGPLLHRNIIYSNYIIIKLNKYYERVYFTTVTHDDKKIYGRDDDHYSKQLPVSPHIHGTNKHIHGGDESGATGFTETQV